MRTAYIYKFDTHYQYNSEIVCGLCVCVDGCRQHVARSPADASSSRYWQVRELITAAASRLYLFNRVRRARTCSAKNVERHVYDPFGTML